MAIYYKTNTQIRREAQQRARRFQRFTVAVVFCSLAFGCVASVNEWINVLTAQGVL